MVAVDAFFDAHFAERMAALGDVRVFVGVAADHAFGEAMDDFINTDFEAIVVVRFDFAEHRLRDRRWVGIIGLVLRLQNPRQ